MSDLYISYKLSVGHTCQNNQFKCQFTVRLIVNPITCRPGLEKVFDKIGIMNDSIAKKCNEASKKIRP